ncbi:tripartite ATP-independent transporter DctM subunit [Haloferula luteola]|uniref:Tripartite ATP-independent transporter DctM subunit n=1 Tax=Haloferula luteola TaxID=595692 RepID=A0A840V004_9BACT|nr:TRAP transporter large permease [Haloferula luteola]MBB5351697.1 tripartite ATP-independent transporter DctM subunit [Haloferula luteola]
MSVGLAVLLVAFVVLLLLEVPVAFVIGLATLLGALALGRDGSLVSLASDMANGLDSFPLLAIPFFILAGELMAAGGLARRMIDFAAAIVGRVPGGLALINTLTCMLFGAVSGSATAAISSIGGSLIPEMERKGYPRDFSVALTATAATTGLLIPPSNVMIVYALVASNVSVGALFLAGIFPGVVSGLALMIVALMVSRGFRRETPAGAAVVEEVPPFLRSFLRAFPSLLMLVLVLGVILGGIMTPTESSALAVLWALLLVAVIYREIRWSQLPQILIQSARTTGIVLLLVGTSAAMSRLLTIEQVPQVAANALLGVSENPLVILLLINLALLLVGVFMDMTPAILVFTPIFLPVAVAIDLHPVHFGIIMVANLCIGLCTPPVGTCLFLGCGVGKAKIAGVSKAMVPFYIAMFAALLVITYWEDLSLWLPRALGELE